MDNKRRIARAALFSLKEVVLEVLYEARDEGRLHPEDISNRLGIPKSESSEIAYGLIRGVLFLLKDEQYNGQTSVDFVVGEGWKITGEAASLLDDLPSE